MDFTREQIEKYANFALGGKRTSSNHKFRTTCPIHGGSNPNFSFDLDTGLWYCHSKCKQGGGLTKLEMALNGEDYESAARKVALVTGAAYHAARGSRRPVTSYSYFDASGRVLFEKFRYVDGAEGRKKSFSFRQPKGDDWEWRSNVPKVLILLP
jgi:CHC2 zinc finger